MGGSRCAGAGAGQSERDGRTEPKQRTEQAVPPVGAIFDCDGVLIDSAHTWRDTERELARRAGTPLSDDDVRAIVTMTLEEVGDYLHRTIGLGDGPEAVTGMIDELMVDFYRSRARALPGVLDFLAALKERGVRMCVVSSSPSLYLDLGLKRIGAEGLFQAVLSVEELNTTKRHPDIYRRAMRIMGTEPCNTWGFDDSYYACQSMAAIGVSPVGVFDASDPYELEKLRAASVMCLSDFREQDPGFFADGPRTALRLPDAP